MTPLAEDRTRARELLGRLYAPVQAELDQVEQRIGEELRSEHPFVDGLVRHGFRLGGKRLRPALVLLSAKAAGTLTAAHLALATAVELIHTATLIHDDVLDEATLRRHLETINARWDNEASVLLGDYLYARAMCLVASLDDTFAGRAIGQAVRTVCEGELRQIHNRGNFALSEQQYVEIIADKTAALTACCCRVGAHYAGALPPWEEALSGYGQQLGIAFQMADDLLDMLGQEATVGKSLGTDLQKQKPTLALIRVLQQAAGEDRAAVMAVLTGQGNHQREALRPFLERFDAIGYARGKAMQFVQGARTELDPLPPSEARTALEGLTEFVVQRQQ